MKTCKIKNSLVKLALASTISFLTPTIANAWSSNTSGVATALDEISLSGATGTLSDIIQQLNTMNNDELAYAYSTLAPIVDGAIMAESFQRQQNVFGYVTEHMDRMNFWRNHVGKSNFGGFAAGDDWTDFWEKGDRSTWIKGFRQHGNQSERQGIPGYEQNTNGLVAGFDNTFNETMLLGAALSYSYADVDHKVSERANTKINSYQATVYGSLDCRTPWFFKGQMGGAYNHYNITRTIDFGDVFLRPFGETDGWQVGLSADAGYVFDWRNVHVTPSLSMFYSHLDLDSFDETSAGTASQEFTNSDFDAFVMGFGVRFAQDYLYHNKLIQPEVHAYYYYDFINDLFETNSMFNGFGPSFVTSGVRADPDSYQLGFSLSVFTLYKNNFQISYDYLNRSDYKSHTGFIKWRMSLPL